MRFYTSILFSFKFELIINNPCIESLFVFVVFLLKLKLNELKTNLFSGFFAFIRFILFNVTIIVFVHLHSFR